MGGIICVIFSIKIPKPTKKTVTAKFHRSKSLFKIIAYKGEVNVSQSSPI